MTPAAFAGRLLYGALFVVVIPVALFLWARATAPVVRLPAVDSPSAGGALAAVGALLLVAGWIGIVRRGEGLPMNAFPPKRLVTSGAFRLVAHPIYTGFVLLVAGVSIVAGSASGLWLVTPVVALGCAALVIGHERPELDRRFGTGRPRPWLSLPAADDRPPSIADRFAVVFLVLAPWLVGYEGVRFLGVPADAISTLLPFEARWPVFEGGEVLYGSVYLVVLAAPFFARRSRDLRDFAVGGWIATAIGLLLFVSLPFVSPPRPFEPTGWLGRLLALERSVDTSAAAFPSFHVAWAVLAARLLARGRGGGGHGAATAWCLAVAAACVATGQHSLLDVVGGLGLGLAAAAPERLRGRIRGWSERRANAWREWTRGGVRLIHHSLWAGLAGGTGLLVAGVVAGPGMLGSVAAIGLAGVVGAGLWAQLVEGSSRLARPFGYYGGVFGAVAGAVGVAVALGGDVAWVAAGAWVVAAPAVQALGRIRCLENGCCHGRPTSESIGIRVTHPRSRVVRLAELAGIPVHPTQTYSILWNLAVLPLLLRLWFVAAPLPFVVGIYLLASGLGRFAEEAWRGEPQTPAFAGLRLYQWLSIGFVAAGVVATVVTGPAAPRPVAPRLAVAAAALAYGLLTGAAMGVDFPKSDRRFARLA